MGMGPGMGPGMGMGMDTVTDMGTGTGPGTVTGANLTKGTKQNGHTNWNDTAGRRYHEVLVSLITGRTRVSKLR